MRDRSLQHRSFEWFCVCLIFTPCAALAQQAAPASQAAAASPDAAVPSAPAPAATAAAQASGDASSAAPTHGAAQKQTDDLEPAVNTSPEGASRSSDARADKASRDAKQGPHTRASGKAMDHLDLGTTDITGNRELPKVMYIVPWKRSDLGDLTGKPLNSLVDQTLEPVDRNVFERSNRYYGAVTTGATTGGAATGGASSTGASQDVHRTPGAGSGSAARDER